MISNKSTDLGTTDFTLHPPPPILKTRIFPAFLSEEALPSTLFPPLACLSWKLLLLLLLLSSLPHWCCAMSCSPLLLTATDSKSENHRICDGIFLLPLLLVPPPFTRVKEMFETFREMFSGAYFYADGLDSQWSPAHKHKEKTC